MFWTNTFVVTAGAGHGSKFPTLVMLRTEINSTYVMKRSSLTLARDVYHSPVWHHCKRLAAL